MKSIGPRVVNSIMSDSAAPCKEAREDLTSMTGFKHIIHHRCLPHLFNNIGAKAYKPKSIDGMIKKASAITSFLSQSSYSSAHINRYMV